MVNVLKENIVPITAATAGIAGVVYWIIGLPRESQQREAAKERLYYNFNAIPEQQRPAVAELLRELQQQDPHSVAGYRIEHVLHQYK